MKINNVPYVEDKKEVYASCQGPTTVMMVFKYFSPKEPLSFPRLYKKLNYTHKTWFFETYIAQFFHEHKIPIKYYSTENIKFIRSNSKIFKEICGLDFKNPIDRDALDIDHYDLGIKYVKRHNLFKLRDLDIDFIKEQITNNKLVIATVNRNILTNQKGYKGHFLLIKGFNQRGFICNDSYFGENINIKFSSFEKVLFTFKKDKNHKKIKICDLVVVG